MTSSGLPARLLLAPDGVAPKGFDDSDDASVQAFCRPGIIQRHVSANFLEPG